MNAVARGFDLSSGFLFAALLTSRILIFGSADYSAGNAFVAVVCGVLVATCGLACLAGGEFRVARSRAWIPLGVYLLICLFSLVFASNRAASLRELGAWVVYGGAFVAASTWARTDERRRLVYAAFIAAACVEGLYAFFQRRVGLPVLRAQIAVDPQTCPELVTTAAGRMRAASDLAFGTFVYPNALAGFLVLALPVAAAFAVRAVRRKKRADAACMCLVSGVLFLALLAASFQIRRGAVEGSVGGCVALVAGVGLFAARKRWLPRARAVAAAGVGALALGSLAAPFVFAPASPLGSAGVRREYWKAALSMIRAHPLGVGLANFGEHYPAFKTALGEETRQAHNAFFQNWTELGLWGVLAFAVLWWALIADASEEHGEAGAKADTGLVYLGFGGGLFAFFVSYVFLGTMNSNSFSGLLGAAAFPYLGLTGACHLFYPLVWLGVFACAMKTGVRARGFLACALAALLVHSAVDFDMRIKGIVLPAFALAGTAGWARGEMRFRPGRRLTFGLAAALAVVVTAWIDLLAATPLTRYSAKARAERMDEDGRRLKAAAAEIAVLRRTSPERAARSFAALAAALPGRELDKAARALGAAEGEKKEEILRQAVRLLPGVARAYAGEAAIAWAEFARRAPLDPEAHSSLARALGSLSPTTPKVLDAREAELKEAIRLGPVSPGKRESLGHFYFGQRRSRDAAVAYEKAVELYPLKPVYRYYLGDAFLRFSPERAREQYGRAFEVNRRLVDHACLLQGIFWNRLSYVRKGAAELRTLELLEKEESPEAAARLGLLLSALRRRGEAKEVFSALAGRLPDDPQALSFSACALEATLDPRAAATWKELRELQAAFPSALPGEAVKVLTLHRKWMRSAR